MNADAHHQHHHHHPVGEVSWNPAQVCVDFQVASAILSDRGLKVATKWIAELWMGLPPEIIDTTTATTGKYDTNHHDATMMMCSIPDRLHVVSETNPAVAYAKSLLDLGEYAHAAAILSETSLNNPGASVETMNPPLTDLCSKAIFYRAYALYLAGEKRKHERVQQQEKYVCLRHHGPDPLTPSALSFFLLGVFNSCGDYLLIYIYIYIFQSIILVKGVRTLRRKIRTCSNSRPNCITFTNDTNSTRSDCMYTGRSYHDWITIHPAHHQPTASSWKV
jgi:Anaphase promoting complex subunit 8 / Cdc23